jgi:hypothetical protein
MVQQKVAGANAADPSGSQLIQNSETAHLVGGFSHLENISQWEGLSHILWKIIQMFQTTNQYRSIGQVFWYPNNIHI